jgi:hypothetical protein
MENTPTPLLRLPSLPRVYHKRTHCQRGHDLSIPGATFTRQGARRCVLCRRTTERRRYYAKWHPGMPVPGVEPPSTAPTPETQPTPLTPA